MSVAGTFECITKTPMGEQKSTLIIIPDESGSAFTGTNATEMGTLELADGVIEGDRITWSMKMTVPMPMTLTGEAIIDGDTITGKVKAGLFGTSPMSGKRIA